jgi:hypothetical protein
MLTPEVDWSIAAGSGVFIIIGAILVIWWIIRNRTWKINRRTGSS